MAVTTGGLPVRLWVWPGNTTDTTVLAEVKEDLAGWQLNRTVWIADAGFASKDNRKILTRERRPGPKSAARTTDDQRQGCLTRTWERTRLVT